MTRQSTFADLVHITRQVVAAFDAAERRTWTIEVTALELAKQVGDLSKRILAAEGYYLADRDSRPDYAARPADIGDELADILYCLIRIGDHYDIDLESAHLAARPRRDALPRPGANLLTAPGRCYPQRRSSRPTRSRTRHSRIRDAAS